MQNTVTFTVDVKGADTQEQYKGLFKVKTKLSMRETLREDEVRRGLLGTKPEAASEYAQTVAAALAYLAVRVEDAPGWWKDANGGVDLQDENVLVVVHNACAKEITKLYEEQAEQAEQARDRLKKQKSDEEV